MIDYKLAKLLFITGTDTGIGKTVVTCLLAKQFVGMGLKVGVMKPFASGSLDDTSRLMKYSNVDLKTENVTPAYFRLPIAPYSASKLEGSPIRISHVDHALATMRKKCHIVLVEGIGGPAVPIKRNLSVGDWAAKYKMSTLVVSHPWLGCLNHVVLTMKYLNSIKLSVEGLVINRSKRVRRDVAEKSNLEILSSIADTNILADIPYLQNLRVRKHYFSRKWIDLWKGR